MRPSQSLWLLAELEPDLPKHVVAGGIVIVVVLEVGIANLTVVVVSIVVVVFGTSVFLTHVRLKHVSPFVHISLVFIFWVATQYEPPSSNLHVAVSVTSTTLSILQRR